MRRDAVSHVVDASAGAGASAAPTGPTPHRNGESLGAIRRRGAARRRSAASRRNHDNGVRVAQGINKDRWGLSATQGRAKSRLESGNGGAGRAEQQVQGLWTPPGAGVLTFLLTFGVWMGPFESVSVRFR